MNKPESSNTFTPNRALKPTPQLYAELTGSTMEKLAAASFSKIPAIAAESVVHDMGCGTGAGTGGIIKSLASGVGATDVTIHATDINEDALTVYRAVAETNGWGPVKVSTMDALKLEFPDQTFTHTIGNALLFVLPGDGIGAVSEAYRTLKPGGTLLINTWGHIPNIAPLHAANAQTRPEGTPQLRLDIQKWLNLDFVRGIVEQGGFSPDRIQAFQEDVICDTPELNHYANMLWSFIGGTNKVGWIPEDEENWDRAIAIIKDELRKTDGYEDVDGGKARLKFVANIVVATK